MIDNTPMKRVSKIYKQAIARAKSKNSESTSRSAIMDNSSTSMHNIHPPKLPPSGSSNSSMPEAE